MCNFMNIIDELKWRGAVNQQTDEQGLYDLVGKQSISVYCGVDPTGDSMHVGHLIPFMILKRFQLAGHHPYMLIGGGTGSIGDPSGRKTERVLQTMDKVQHNVECLTAQLTRLFGGCLLYTSSLHCESDRRYYTISASFYTNS